VASLTRGRLIGAGLVVFSAAAFSAKAIIIKLAYRYGTDAVTLLALRMAFSAPFFLALAWWWSRGGRGASLTRGDWRAIAILGMLGYYLASLFDFLGLQYITAALERLVLFLYPTFVVLISAAWLGRRIGGRDVAALALSYAGIALVFVNDLATQQENVLLGAFWVTLSALCYAVYLIGNGRMVKKMGSALFACLASLVSCVAVIAHFLIVRDAALLWSQPAEVYGLVLLMALVSTVLPIILMSEGIRRIGSSHASMLGTVGPVTTIGLGAVFLGEAVTAIQLAGAALVMAGVLAISLAKGTGKPD
jgi:drug/metabolite transporter (DMT)-like permease